MAPSTAICEAAGEGDTEEVLRGPTPFSGIPVEPAERILVTLKYRMRAKLSVSRGSRHSAGEAS